MYLQFKELKNTTKIKQLIHWRQNEHEMCSLGKFKRENLEFDIPDTMVWSIFVVSWSCAYSHLMFM